MNIRTEVEGLIYWYVSSILVALVVGSILSAYIKSTNDTSSVVIWSYGAGNILISYLHHIVVAIWLYRISKRSNQKYFLWALFGLVAHLFAAVIFLVVYFYERNESIENK